MCGVDGVHVAVTADMFIMRYCKFQCQTFRNSREWHESSVMTIRIDDPRHKLKHLLWLWTHRGLVYQACVLLWCHRSLQFKRDTKDMKHCYNNGASVLDNIEIYLLVGWCFWSKQWWSTEAIRYRWGDCCKMLVHGKNPHHSPER